MKPILALYGIKDRYRHEYPAYVHDHNLTFLEDGKVNYYLHLERQTRRKYDNRLHSYIDAILDHDLSLRHQEFDLVSVNSFVGQSFISDSGRFRISPCEPMQVSTKAQEATAWFQAQPWEGIFPRKSYIVSHELAHIFSCLPFYGHFKENSLLVHFDGGASLSNFSAFHYKNGKLQLLEYHWGLSHLSKLFNDNALSFSLLQAAPGEHCSVPGKLMGYGAMTHSYKEIEEWLLEHACFKNIWNDKTPFYEVAAADFNWKGNLDDQHDLFLKRIAASIQSIFQKGIIKKISTLQESIQAKYLYYTGGCALNIRTNSALANSTLFDNVYIPPACNDSGLSLGAAAFVHWKQGGLSFEHHPYLHHSPDNTTVSFSLEDIKIVAEHIVAGKIIGVCNGKAEVGPRALGNRSIIARADDVALAQKVSRECKGREWYRPIAPIMLERNAKKVINKNKIHRLSKYMLLDFQIFGRCQDEIKGVIHQNGTSRIQILFDKNDNPFIYELLNYLDKEYRIIALINTSFNGKGEPIVNTHSEALQSAKSMGLDGLIINGTYQEL